MYFVFGSKKTEDWPRGRHFVDFSVGRSADEQISGGIEGERLGRQFGGFEYAGRLAAGVDSQHFRVRAARRVEISLRIGANLEEIREVGVRKFREPRGEKHFAVTAQRDAFGRPFVKFFKRGLPPPARVFGERGRPQRRVLLRREVSTCPGERGRRFLRRADRGRLKMHCA